MTAKNVSNRSEKHGSNVKSHGLSPEQIVEIINNLDNPTMAVYQTNRVDKNRNDIPNNVAFFVEYNNNGTEAVAVIEFDSEIDPQYIGTEYGDTNYHTVVTVFSPDESRNGIEFDYAEELLSNPDIISLEIKKGQPARSATQEIHPNTSSKLPFGISVPQSGNDVNTKLSVSDTDCKQLSQRSAGILQGFKDA